MEESGSLLDETACVDAVNPGKDFFPMSIVWSPIPMLTWILPISGHLGMSASDGLISDFGGSFYIHQHRRRTAFGPVTKFVHIRPSDLHALPPGTSEGSAIAAWNRAVAAANKSYETHMHNLLLDNCHHHVAVALNELKYLGYSKWDTTSLHLHMIRRGRFVSVSRFLMTYGGFLFLLGLVLLIVLLVKLV